MRYLPAVVFCASFTFPTGCAMFTGQRDALGEAQQVVLASVDATGGRQQWDRIRTIEADAVVTSYNETGLPLVVRQRVSVDLRANRITATGELPRGQYTAIANQRGLVRVRTDGFSLDPQFVRRLEMTLPTMLHRIRGPLNLVLDDFSPSAPQETTVGGERVLRVGVQNDVLARAYYFGAATSELRFVTAGADHPGGDGTITVYRWQELPGGMAVPERLTVLSTGRYVLLGQIRLWVAELRNVQLR